MKEHALIPAHPKTPTNGSYRYTVEERKAFHKLFILLGNKPPPYDTDPIIYKRATTE